MVSFRRNFIKSLLLCATAIFIASSYSSPAYAQTNWQQSAIQDLRYISYNINSFHAGAVNKDALVLEPFEEAKNTAFLEARSVHSQEAYNRVMMKFISRLGDPHASIRLNLKTRGWTGIVLDYVGGQYRVVWADHGSASLPVKGDLVKSCEGIWIGTYLKLRVAPYTFQGSEYTNTSGEYARNVMFDQGMGWTPKNCVFINAAGLEKNYDLIPMQAGSQSVDEKIAAARSAITAVARPVGLYPIEDKVYVAGMPDFNEKKSGAAYNELYRILRSIGSAKWVVFDMRGNGGGDSTIGSRALEALYGKDYSDVLMQLAAYREDIVANSKTVNLFSRLATSSDYSASREEINSDLARLKLALESGQPMTELDSISPEEVSSLRKRADARPTKTRIAAFIDRSCFSSCMDFLLQLKAVPGALLLGESTFGYSPYGEIDRFDLPSGNGSFQLPASVFYGTQAPREPFIPDFSYPGDMTDDKAIMQWILMKLRDI